MTKISHKHGKGYCVEDKGQFYFFKTIQEAMAKGLEIDSKKNVNKSNKDCIYKVYIVYYIYRGKQIPLTAPKKNEQNKRQNCSRLIQKCNRPNEARSLQKSRKCK